MRRHLMSVNNAVRSSNIPPLTSYSEMNYKVPDFFFYDHFGPPVPGYPVSHQQLAPRTPMIPKILMEDYKDGVFICTTCNKSYKHKTHLKRHIDEGCPSVTDGVMRRFACENCDKTYKHKRHLQRHQKDECIAVAAAPRFKCDMCPSAFKRRYHLTRHHLNTHGYGKSIGIGKIEQIKEENNKKNIAFEYNN